jgi:hypothetical protein
MSVFGAYIFVFGPEKTVIARRSLPELISFTPFYDFISQYNVA